MSKPYLIFIDTNIYLDFYRVRGQDIDLSLLNYVDQHHDKLISTYQVEMEYKKNRQRVILDTLQMLKPDSSNSSTPAYLKESKPQKALVAAHKQVKNQTKRLKERTTKTLMNPSLNDPIYKTLQRLFRANNFCHLTRNDEIRFTIRELAQKRFTLGYPPRKNSDTSIGDAINWEWIIHCASQCDDNIIIVSRDSDYGAILDGQAYLNDWLHQEFKQRVSRKRDLILTTRLTEAFKLAGIRVKKKEVEQENQFIEVASRKKPVAPDQVIFRNFILDAIKDKDQNLNEDDA